MNWILRLLYLYRPYLVWMFFGVLVALITVLANVALMATSGWFITSMAAAGLAGVTMNYFSPAAVIRALAIIRTGGRYGERLITHELTFRMLSELRQWFYLKLEPLVPSVLEDYQSGDILNRIRTDIDTLDNFYLRLLIPSIVALLATIVLTIAVLYYNGTLAIVLVVAIALSGIALPLMTLRMGGAPGSQLIRDSAIFRSSAIDSVQGLDELIVAGADEEAFCGLIDQSDALIHSQSKLAKLNALSRALVLLVNSITVILTLTILVPTVRDASMNSADLVMLLLLVIASFEVIAPLPEAFRLYGQIKTAAQRIFSMADIAVPVLEPETPLVKPEVLNWQFKSVGFRYKHNQSTVLESIDLSIKTGQKIAVVGTTGSGKSTLVQLLSRSREPTAGKVVLSGQDLENFSSDDVRSWMSVIPQHVHMFANTIRGNLCLAKPDASDAELEHVCKVAQIGAFIDTLENGYDTWLGESASQLSMGQARRLAVARALLKDFDLLVMDEPMEGLDATTAKNMMRAVLQEVSAKSVILITHQLTGLESFDEIIVMEEGRIVERGTQTELLELNDRFAKLFTNQVFVY